MRPVFLHIPKAAGSSVKALLYENYGESFVFVDNSWEVRDELLHEPEKFAQYLAFAGHIPLWAYLNFERLGFFACVRSPFERHQSAYAFAKRDGAHPRHWHAHNFTFEEWLRDEREWNEQCSYLIAGSKEVMEGPNPIRTLDQVRWSLKLTALRIAPLPHLHILLENLKRAYSWHTALLPLINRSSPVELPEMTEPCRTLIQSNDHQDLALYEWLMREPPNRL